MATATFVYGKPVTVQYTPGAAVAAGDVVVIDKTPCVAHTDIPAFTGGPMTDALAVGGGVYQLATDGTPVKGDKVYYNATSKKLTATAAGNTHFGILVAGPTRDMGGAGPAADGDFGLAYHQPSGA